MLISSMSLQVDIQFQLHSINNSLLKALNGLAQLIMGPLDIDKDEHKSFLNVVNRYVFNFIYKISYQTEQQLEKYSSPCITSMHFPG